MNTSSPVKHGVVTVKGRVKGGRGKDAWAEAPATDTTATTRADNTAGCMSPSIYKVHYVEGVTTYYLLCLPGTVPTYHGTQQNHIYNYRWRRQWGLSVALAGVLSTWRL